MVSDQWNALSAQALIYLRGLSEDSVLNMLDLQKQSFANTPLKRVESLPWYCFDMHTRPGMLAMRVWLKNHKTSLIHDEERLGTVWFQLTSAMLGKEVRPDYQPIGREVGGWHESIWEAEKEESIAEWLGVSVEKMKAHWSDCLPKVRELVEWAIRKSGE